jgi:glyoxylase-like metal-dependent hydrolase (beta-lactamase superfamily II)
MVMDARIDRVVTSGEITEDGVTHAMTNNTWVIGDNDEVIVIDPGHDAQEILEKIGDREVLAVICTHGHRDHVAAALEVAERDEAPIALHPKDFSLWRETHPDDDPEIEMADGGVFEVSDARLEVIVSPGHTPGSICLYCEELGAVFSGDTLLASGPGRYCGEFPNFPAQLTAVGEYLLTLPPSTRVLAGHGEEITVRAAERRFDSWVTAGPDAPEVIPGEDDDEETPADPEDVLQAAEAALKPSHARTHVGDEDVIDAVIDDDEDDETETDVDDQLDDDDEDDDDEPADLDDEADDDDEEDDEEEPEPVAAARPRGFLRRSRPRKS